MNTLDSLKLITQEQAQSMFKWPNDRIEQEYRPLQTWVPAHMTVEDEGYYTGGPQLAIVEHDRYVDLLYDKGNCWGYLSSIKKQLKKEKMNKLATDWSYFDDGYSPHQGNKTNFEYMSCQLKQLEKIYGNVSTGKWLSIPNHQLNDKTPAEVALLTPGDKGFKIIGDLVSDMITGSPT